MFGRLVRPGVGVAIAVAVAACGGVDRTPASGQAGTARALEVQVQVGDRAQTAPLRGGFLGLSIEVPSLTAYAGRNPAAVNPVFEQLIRNLAPGQEPVLRIGGDSTDVSWIPARGLHRPRGVTYTISRRWLAVARALARALGARLILGVDLEAGSPALAAAEARGFVAAIGRRYVRALELGNEGNRYASLPWYRIARHHLVFARRRGYDFNSFAADFARAARRMPSVPLAGPTVGSLDWLSHLGGFLAAEPQVRLATFHRYPLNRCFTPTSAPTYPTIAHLLSAQASEGLLAGVRPYVALAHRRGVAFRVDEYNSVACGGQLGISNTFASALWALDATFRMAWTGVDGVNVHTFPGARYELFSFRRTDGRWTASVRPEYYGLMMFAQAAPPGSQLVSVRLAGAGNVRAWATRGSAGRVRVVLINDDRRDARVASVKLSLGTWPRTATLERLQAPELTAISGVKLGGQSFGRLTSTGELAPHATRLRPVGRAYRVVLPAASAALLTVPAE
jgi:hypothetical protein